MKALPTSPPSPAAAILIWSDGAVYPPDAGGWAAVIRAPGLPERVLRGRARCRSNIVMEMLALHTALRTCPDGCAVRVCIDWSLNPAKLRTMRPKPPVAPPGLEARSLRDALAWEVTRLEVDEISALGEEKNESSPHGRCHMISREEARALDSTAPSARRTDSEGEEASARP